MNKKRMLVWLEKLEQVVNSLSKEELEEIISRVTDKEAKQFEKIEKMLLTNE